MNNVALKCSDAVNTTFGNFDFTIAPPLLYYAYIPIAILTLLFGIWVLIKDKYSLQSKLFLGISISFVLYILNEIVLWTAVYARIIDFGWQMAMVLQMAVWIFSLYFIYFFITKKKVEFHVKVLFSILLAPLMLLFATKFNIAYFDLTNCEAVSGRLWYYMYAVQMATLVFTEYSLFSFYKHTEDKITKRQTIFGMLGVLVFLGIFSVSIVYGELTKVYEINLVGPIGLTCFIGILAYMIVKYQAFNTKFIAAQALVWTQGFLILALLFIQNIQYLQIAIALTLVLTVGLGYRLVRSVKKEIEQREYIEKLAIELQDTNERQEGLIHFIGHEVKGFLTKDAGAFAALAEGDFGKLSDGSSAFVQNALAQTRAGIGSVTNLLLASNMKKGTTIFKKELFDLAALAADVVQKLKQIIEEKSLAITLTADPSGVPYMITGDKVEIGDHVLRNLIDNAINYTPSGAIHVSLERTRDKSLGKDKIIFAVKDSGVGITDEDKKRLFIEGGHGKESQKINAHSTGYGLFIAKKVVVAHGGTIRAESEGQGKGSTFIVELPV